MERRFIYYIPPTSFVAGHGHRVSIVFENESGHFPTGGGNKAPWYWGDSADEGKSFKNAEETAKKANAKLGLDEKEVLDILSSSMTAK